MRTCGSPKLPGLGTDVYRWIEVRDPGGDEQGCAPTPWQRAVDLYPLHAGRDYAAFACLFGVRNDAGWEPLAPARGLPPDVSAEGAQTFAGLRHMDPAVHGATWLTWAERARADMDAAPAGSRGVLLLTDGRAPATVERHWVREVWPRSVVHRLGAFPVLTSPAETPYGAWTVGSTTLTFRRFTRRDAVGPGTEWEHVWAVMRALAGRFGGDGVRLVVFFD
ncbi:hypothetical protein [Streptomyces sp. CC53]|uniref:hypothetical protein n=1 Tax=Streptomyces sp. CC53 TaxID=1906740 RepID=UPI00115FD0E4|nr:hypothetical protein [Streptomyces sp. CC53]